MAESEVAIANRALQLLGARRIADFSQDSPNARSMSTAYVPVRDALQRRYNWNFCIKRASIAADATGTAYEGLLRYQKPNDFLRLLREKNTAHGQESFKDWQIEGNYIITSDGSPLQFRYLARVTDPAMFDPMFDELLAATIALNTVNDVSGSKSTLRELRAMVLDARTAARQANSFENAAEEPPEDEWLQVMR